MPRMAIPKNQLNRGGDLRLRAINSFNLGGVSLQEALLLKSLADF